MLTVAFVIQSLPVICIGIAHNLQTLFHYQQFGDIKALYAEPEFGLMAFQMAIALLATPLWQAIIVWLSMDSSKPGGRKLWQAYGVLLKVNLLRLTVTTIGWVGLSPLLRRFYFDPVKSWHVWMGIERAITDAIHQLGWRSLMAYWPTAQFSLDWVDVTLWSQPTPMLIVMSGLLIILPCFVLCFAAPVMMDCVINDQPMALITLLGCCTRVSVKSCAMVVAHLCASRFIVLALTLAFIELPIAFVEQCLMPHIVLQSGYVSAIALVKLGVACCAPVVYATLASGLLASDMQLYQALHGFGSCAVSA